MKQQPHHNTRNQSHAGRMPDATRRTMPQILPAEPHASAAGARDPRYPSLAGDSSPWTPCDRWPSRRSASAHFNGDRPRGSSARVIALLAIIAIIAVLAAMA